MFKAASDIIIMIVSWVLKKVSKLIISKGGTLLSIFLVVVTSLDWVSLLILLGSYVSSKMEYKTTPNEKTSGAYSKMKASLRARMQSESRKGNKMFSSIFYKIVSLILNRAEGSIRNKSTISSSKLGVIDRIIKMFNDILGTHIPGVGSTSKAIRVDTTTVKTNKVIMLVFFVEALVEVILHLISGMSTEDEHSYVEKYALDGVTVNGLVETLKAELGDSLSSWDDNKILVGRQPKKLLGFDGDLSQIQIKAYDYTRSQQQTKEELIADAIGVPLSIVLKVKDLL